MNIETFIDKLSYEDRLRNHQIYYREQQGWPYGINPYSTIANKEYKTPESYIHNGYIVENEKNNFIDDRIYQYVKQRITNKRPEETLQPTRLLHNMLSSQPMAFNLFYPLMLMMDNGYSSAVTKVFKELFKSLPIHEVYSIGIEYIPENYGDYLNDKTAMDAVVRFKDKLGSCYFIAVEMKYTDRLGSNEASDIVTAQRILDEINHFKVRPLTINQIYRNYLLSEIIRIKGDAFSPNGYQDCYAWILAPENHPTTEKEIKMMMDNLKDDFKVKYTFAKGIHLEQFAQALINETGIPDEYRNIYRKFDERYLPLKSSL